MLFSRERFYDSLGSSSICVLSIEEKYFPKGQLFSVSCLDSKYSGCLVEFTINEHELKLILEKINYLTPIYNGRTTNFYNLKLDHVLINNVYLYNDFGEGNICCIKMFPDTDFSIPLTPEIMKEIFSNSENELLQDLLSIELKGLLLFAASIPEEIKLLIEVN